MQQTAGTDEDSTRAVVSLARMGGFQTSRNQPMTANKRRCMRPGRNRKLRQGVRLKGPTHIPWKIASCEHTAAQLRPCLRMVVGWKGFDLMRWIRSAAKRNRTANRHVGAFDGLPKHWMLHCYK